MRTISFRDDVLHVVADKMGLDPEQSNFLTNQAIPIGKSIDQWVRRTYDARDWPEWTITHVFSPSNNVVPWDIVRTQDGTGARRIGRVLKVYLVDPNTTDAPVDTPFTLQNDGIHVGYEHGSAVWMRYMPPPPRFTAVQWDSAHTYKLDEIAYSYTSGECYRSKVNSNIGHDPASNFSLPPGQDTTEWPPPPAPTTEITQEWVPDQVGLAERNQILVVSMSDAFTGTTPTDPTEDGTDFNVQVYDVATETLIAGVLHTAAASESLSSVVADLVAQLQADPDLSAYTITAGLTTITLENNSLFTVPASSYTIPSEGGPTHLMKAVVTQTYTPPVASVAGTPQVARITITEATTYPGSIYELVVTDSAGTEHFVQYASQTFDNSANILQGIIVAIESDTTDAFWDGVQLAFDPDGITLDVSVRDRASVMLRPAPPPAPPPTAVWWELVPFPKAIAEQVIRGAYADLLKEWGSHDKAAAEEQSVSAEASVSEAKFTTTPNPALTGQQGSGLSRYRV